MGARCQPSESPSARGLNMLLMLWAEGMGQVPIQAVCSAPVAVSANRRRAG